MRQVLLAFVLSIVSLGATASTIYNVNRAVGDGSIVGMIEVSGTGVLSEGNILDWNLLIDNGLDTFQFTSDNSRQLVGGQGLTATGSDLLFDFDVSGPRASLFGFDSSNNTWCVEQAGCGGSYREYVMVNGVRTSELRTGVVVIGSVIPVPAAAWLFGSALGLLGWLRRIK